MQVYVTYRVAKCAVEALVANEKIEQKTADIISVYLERLKQGNRWNDVRYQLFYGLDLPPEQRLSILIEIEEASKVINEVFNPYSGRNMEQETFQGRLELIAEHGFEVYLCSDGIIALSRHRKVIGDFTCPKAAIQCAEKIIGDENDLPEHL